MKHLQLCEACEKSYTEGGQTVQLQQGGKLTSRNEGVLHCKVIEEGDIVLELNVANLHKVVARILGKLRVTSAEHIQITVQTTNIYFILLK